ncbi:MAG: hypothetical protein OEL77_04090 [Nitrosopumilus sp.]|nr:hypothetical protein [Nitrosopumilus sp.]MDH3385178.1 hypothetical protein [Nitrosopumilus sp.]
MTVDEIRQIIEKLHLRVPKDFKKMSIPQLSNELRGIMEFERQTFQKIEDLEKKGIQQDMIKYAKIICKNTIQREITEIQEIYLKKIDNEYLNSN